MSVTVFTTSDFNIQNMADATPLLAAGVKLVETNSNINFPEQSFETKDYWTLRKSVDLFNLSSCLKLAVVVEGIKLYKLVKI